MRRVVFWVVILGLFSVPPLLAGELSMDFEDQVLGSMPRDFYSAQTGDRGHLASWKVVEDFTAPKGAKVLVVSPDPGTNRGNCFNVIIYRDMLFRDLSLSVWVKALGGQEDQGGGPLWRARGANDYYVVRWNPLEDNFRLYYVKNGKRKMLASAQVKARPNKWHLIQVIHRGRYIRCSFDGEELIKVTDATFFQPGMVGLWTKADATTAFDGLEVKSLK